MNYLLTKHARFNLLKTEYKPLYKAINSEVQEALKISDRAAIKLAVKRSEETGLYKIRTKMKELCQTKKNQNSLL